MLWLSEEPNEVVLWRAPPMPTGEVDTFVTTVRLKANLIVGNRPVAEDEGDKDRGTEAAYKMIVRLRDLKAVMSMGDAWKRSFDDRVELLNWRSWTTAHSL